MKTYFLIFFAAGLLLFVTGCATNPGNFKNTSSLDYNEVEGQDVEVALKNQPYETIKADSFR